MRRKREITLAAVGIVAVLAACNDLTLDPGEVSADETFVATNTAPDDAPCPPDAPEIQAAQDEGLPVSIYVASDAYGPLHGAPIPQPAAQTTASSTGRFTSPPIPAPDEPGEHWVIAVCGGEDVVDEFMGPEVAAAEVGAAQEQPAIFLTELLTVLQPDFVVSADPERVPPGGDSTASFTWCQNENDSGFFASQFLEPEVNAIVDDHPVIDVYLDGELVDTIEAEERYPTGTVELDFTFDDEGEYEIHGVCTHQTFRWDSEFIDGIRDDLGGGVVPTSAGASGGAGAASSHYPIDFDGIATIDQAEVVSNVVTVSVGVDAPPPAPPAPPEAPPAAGPVTVAPPAAPPAAAAEAVRAAPTFTG